MLCKIPERIRNRYKACLACVSFCQISAQFVSGIGSLPYIFKFKWKRDFSVTNYFIACYCCSAVGLQAQQPQICNIVTLFLYLYVIIRFVWNFTILLAIIPKKSRPANRFIDNE